MSIFNMTTLLSKTRKTKYFSLHELVQNYTNMDKRKNSTDFGKPSLNWFINVLLDN